MKTLLTILHVAAGSLALLSGLTAMMARKGSPVHKRTGRVFATMMYVVCLAAILLHVPKGLYFLPSVAVFSIYLAYTGHRAFQLAKHGAAWPDKMAMRLALFMAATMVFISLLPVMHGSGRINFPLNVFGIVLGVFAQADIRRKPQMFTGAAVRRYHLQRMGGAYIAAVTALLVVNGDQWVARLNCPYGGLLLWLLPSIIGTWLIIRVSRAQR